MTVSINSTVIPIIGIRFVRSVLNVAILLRFTLLSDYVFWVRVSFIIHITDSLEDVAHRKIQLKHYFKLSVKLEQKSQKVKIALRPIPDLNSGHGCDGVGCLP